VTDVLLSAANFMLKLENNVFHASLLVKLVSTKTMLAQAVMEETVPFSFMDHNVSLIVPLELKST
jgi:hypothetical protein